MKQIVVIQNSKTKVSIYQTYMVVHNVCEENIIGYRYIKELYINKLIDISIADAIRLSKMFELYFIDQHGYVLATLKVEYEKV